MKNNKKILIIGAGISGSVLAERYAKNTDYEVLIIDKRNHIGGNCYDFYDQNGILAPLYGPHFFHTNDKIIWDYVSSFTDWQHYEHRVLSNIDGRTLVPIPVNIDTINIIFDLKLKDEKEMKAWLLKNTENISCPQNSEEVALKKVGLVLYEKLFKNYTKKQWDKWPSELSTSVLERIPIYTDCDDRYFKDKYQAMPKEGYTKIFDRMLNRPHIKISLGTDFEEYRCKIGEFDKVFFTGRIDDYFNFLNMEKLQYRSVRFEFEHIDKEYFQSRAQINYPNTEKFTRITEPKIATGQNSPGTTIIKEYSFWGQEAYYPVPSRANIELYELYKKKADELEEKGIYFVGRLAEYKYFNMDQAFSNALNLFSRLN